MEPSTCPECSAKTLHTGYGLAYGGMGAYKFCTSCDFFAKERECPFCEGPTENNVCKDEDCVKQQETLSSLAAAPLKKGDEFRFKAEPDDRCRVVTDIVDDVVFFVIHTPYGDEPEEGWVHAESVTPDKVVRLNS